MNELVWPKHCAVLRDTIVILDYGNKLHISSTDDLHSWTTTAAPNGYSSLTTYQSKFVLVGGINKYVFTNQLLTSTTGLDWKTSLPAMPTCRIWTSSVSGGSPEVLVVAGGRDSHYKDLDIVEVLLGDLWMTADSLPTSCWDMRSAFHEGNFYFTGGYDKENILFICSLDSLTASASNNRTTTGTVWREITTPIKAFAITSSLSNLISIDKHSFIRSYLSTARSWIETTSEGDVPHLSVYTSAAVLSSGQLVLADSEGVHKITSSG